MKKLRVLFAILLFSSAAVAQTSVATTSPASSSIPQQKVTRYTLPPDRYQKAHRLNRSYFWYRLLSFVYALAILYFLLQLKLGAKIRQFAESISARHFVQALIVTPLLFITLALFQLPADGYVHRLSTQYGLSIQGWPSWFWDWMKEQCVTILAATIFVWLLYAIIRKSPRRWWLYFWAASLPIAAFLVFLQPLLIDPLFHRFEPLAQKDVALANSLSIMAQRAGEDIPVTRMFWMEASEKTTTLNAYVTGFGASKRIVVWDTTLKKLDTPQIVFVAGHEMGHYALQHIAKGFGLAALFLLVAFYLGFRLSDRVIMRDSKRWEIRGTHDIASLPFLLMLLLVFTFLSSPLVNGISRYFEHQADQYALEITHGLIPDAGEVGAQSFQILGEIGLSDPDPNPLNVILFYDHPPVSDRVQFCLAYDPWSQGKLPELVP